MLFPGFNGLQNNFAAHHKRNICYPVLFPIADVIVLRYLFRIDRIVYCLPVNIDWVPSCYGVLPYIYQHNCYKNSPADEDYLSSFFHFMSFTFALRILATGLYISFGINVRLYFCFPLAVLPHCKLYNLFFKLYLFFPYAKAEL